MKTHHVNLRQITKGIEPGRDKKGGIATRTNELKSGMKGHVDRSRPIHVLTFQEWDPTQNVDMSGPPVSMIISSSELRTKGFKFKEVLPPGLEGTTCGDLLT